MTTPETPFNPNEAPPPGVSNPAFNGYRADLPLCDAHVHLSKGHDLERDLQTVRGIMDHFGMERVALMALPASSHRATIDLDNNARCLAVKNALCAERGDRFVYACAGLVLRGGGADDPGDLLEQARARAAEGFDGFKLLLGKPGMRKSFGLPLDGPVLAPFFSFLEETGLPVTLHSGDPAHFWDPSASVSEEKWRYDSSFPTLESIRAETEGILRAHPRLRMNLAHLFFLGDRPDETERLLETYPHLCFDLTPGGEIFAGMSRDPDRWRGVFTRFPDRFLFGSDCDSWHSSEDLQSYTWNFGFIINLPRAFLERSEPFRFHDCDLGVLRPLHLPDDVLRAVYRDNFVRRFGERPRGAGARRFRWPMSGAELSEFAEILRRGGVAVVPTDTVYGVAASPERPDALSRIAAAKGRDPSKPCQLLAASAEAVARSGAALPPRAAALARAFWPGALTLVLDAASGGTEGFRVPDHEAARALCEAAGGLLRCTSANLSGEAPATTAEAAFAAVPSADAVVDAGPAPGAVASTVAAVDPDGSIRVFREGAVSRAALERAAAGAPAE